MNERTRTSIACACWKYSMKSLSEKTKQSKTNILALVSLDQLLGLMSPFCS